MGIPFGKCGFRCNGSETDILDCPHDATAATRCGTNGVTDGNYDMVGVECD